VLSRELAGGIVLAIEQGSQSRVDTDDVVVPERIRERLVERRQQVIDVRAAGRGVVEIEIPARVGGADDPVLVPGDDEEHAGPGSQDEATLRADPIPRNQQVDPLRGAHPHVTTARHPVHAFRPHAARVDHLARPDHDIATRLETARANRADPAVFLLKAHRPDTRGDRRAVLRRRARERHGVSRVVDLGVVVLDPANQCVAAQRGELVHRSGAREMAVPRQDRMPRQAVVEPDSRADVEPFPDPMGEREQKWNGPYEMRAQMREQQRLLVPGFANQAEVALFEIAKTTVNQFTRAARGP